MKVSKEFKIGLLTIVSGSILYFGFNYLKGINSFSSDHHYYAIYDAVDGLQNSNPVMVNGFTVGRVNSIQILQDRGNKMLVEIEVKSKVAVGNLSEAHLVDNGLLAGKMIELKLKKGTGILNEGDTLISMKPIGMMSKLSEKADPIMENANQTMQSINKLVTEFQGTSENLKSLLINATAATANANQMMSENRGKISAVMANFEKISSDLAKMQTKINPILDKVNTIADSLTKVELAATAAEMKATVAETKKLMQSINAGEGTMGKLMKNEEVYQNMNKTIEDLDKLFLDMKDRPGRYIHFSVFGKKEKDKKKKKGEEEPTEEKKKDE